jgi:lipoate-protein ligase A
MAFVKRVGRVVRLFFQSKNDTIVEEHGKKIAGTGYFAG